MMKVIKALSRTLNGIATVVLGAMVLLTVSDVFLRYVFRRPILGTTELTECMMVLLIFLALAWCGAQGGHLQVDLVLTHLPKRVQAVIDSITSSVGFALVAIIAWRSVVEARAMQDLGIVGSLLNMPVYPFYYVMAAGFIMLCIVIAAQTIQNIGKAVKG
jgi:TRAP-type C4-dicarboxylate transport system permease small subunit